MNASIITIGDEILIGQVIDTNSAWMAKKLNKIGVSVIKRYCISDNKDEIVQALNEAKEKSGLILITGGLGPTKDDITKDTLTEYFRTELVMNSEALANVETYFAKKKRSVLELNREQALMPESCIPLPNPLGTAWGMWFEEDDNIVISMPGVPYEMKEMMDSHVLPKLQEKYNSTVVNHKTVLTQGAGESTIADAIGEWEENLPSHIKLAYLPKPGIVRLRLSGKSNNNEVKNDIENAIEKLKEIIGDLIFGYDEDTLEDAIGNLLRDKKLTLAIAESCTGGNISKMITSVPGSSGYFLGSVVSYANNIKEEILKVDPLDLQKAGAVSSEVVSSMALGVRSLLNADYAIASSGIAGPGGGTTEKPVGLVWLAVAGPNGVKAKKYRFNQNRERNIQMASLTALNMLRKELISKG